MASSEGSFAGEAGAGLSGRGGATGLGVLSLAAGFFLGGFAAVGRGFFAERLGVFAFSFALSAAGTSVCLSASILVFLATFDYFCVFETEYRSRGGCKRILQSGCARRVTSPTVRPCDTLFFAGSLRRWA